MRIVRVSAVALGGMLLVSLLTQPRPFFFDTIDTTESIQRFDQYRVLLLGGGMLRSFLAIPTILFGVALTHQLGPERSEVLSAGKAFMGASGLLLTVSGVVAVVMGVPAEEYRIGGSDAKALEVLADSLFWIQDNLITVAYVTLTLAVLGFSLAMNRSHRLERWGFISGISMIPFTLLVIVSFSLTTPAGSNSPFYFPAAAGVVIAFVVWMTAAVRALSAPAIAN